MESALINRRDFLSTCTGLGAAGVLSSTAVFGAAGPEGNTYPILGYKRMILDYHFSEFNPRTLEKASSREIVEAMANLGIDSLLLYSKDHWGNVYHKTSFSHRHRNVPQDLFGEVIEGLRKHGIRLIAYTTVCWDEDSARKHPDWKAKLLVRGKIFSSADGPDVRANWSFLCINTPYREYFLRQMDELIGGYDFEGLFLDIVFLIRSLVCYCAFCRDRWRKKYGDEMPTAEKDVDYARIIDFTRDNTEEFFAQVREIEKKHGKKFLLTHNFGLTYRYDDYVAMEFDTHGADFYHPATRAKLYRARARGKEVELIGHRFNQSWDFTVKPSTLMRYEVATAVAHNCAMMYVDQPYLDGSLDPQVYDALKKGFEAADDLVPHVKGTLPYAEIALLSSERSFELDYKTYRGFAGAYAMLAQLHWPFDVVTEEALNDAELSRFMVLVVPDIVHLSAARAAAVRKYVEGGGNLLFCYRSATRDEGAGNLSPASFGLLSITGDSPNQVCFVKPRWELSSRYLRVVDAALIEPQAGLKTTAFLVDPALRVTDTEWISHNAMPGEETTNPAVVVGTAGNGRFVYYAFRVFDEYVAQAVPALREIFEKGMRQMYEPQVWVEAPDQVEAVYSRRGDEIRIVLINGIHSKVIAGDLWGAEAAKRGHITLSNVVPVHNLIVRIRSPQVVQAFDLRGRALKVRRSGALSEITVPVLDQYELVRIRRS